MRVHEVLKRKGKTWKSGQKVKILKGACAGVHNNNVYATLEYFLLGGFEGDAGGKYYALVTLKLVLCNARILVKINILIFFRAFPNRRSTDYMQVYLLCVYSNLFVFFLIAQVLSH